MVCQGFLRALQTLAAACAQRGLLRRLADRSASGCVRLQTCSNLLLPRLFVDRGWCRQKAAGGTPLNFVCSAASDPCCGIVDGARTAAACRVLATSVPFGAFAGFSGEALHDDPTGADTHMCAPCKSSL